MISPFTTAEKRGCYTLTRPATKAEILAMAKCLIQRQFDRVSRCQEARIIGAGYWRRLTP